MAVSIHVRRVGPEDAEPLRTLRLRALTNHPTAFIISAEEEAQHSVDDFAELCRTRWAEPDNQMLGAWRDGTLVGMVGFFRDRRAKVRHKLIIWGMYVAPEARRAGVGRALMEAALAAIRAIPDARDVHLAVSATNPAALALYAALGFVAFGREPRSVFVDGAFDDEIHMLLSLKGDD